MPNIAECMEIAVHILDMTCFNLKHQHLLETYVHLFCIHNHSRSLISLMHFISAETYSIKGVMTLAPNQKK